MYVIFAKCSADAFCDLLINNASASSFGMCKIDCVYTVLVFFGNGFVCSYGNSFSGCQHTIILLVSGNISSGGNLLQLAFCINDTRVACNICRAMFILNRRRNKFVGLFNTSVLNPDDSLMKKFQQTLAGHLTRVINKLSEQVLDLVSPFPFPWKYLK